MRWGTVTLGLEVTSKERVKEASKTSRGWWWKEGIYLVNVESRVMMCGECFFSSFFWLIRLRGLVSHKNQKSHLTKKTCWSGFEVVYSLWVILPGYRQACISFTRPKAAGEERSMSCPVLGHRSGWGPHGFSCPPHPFGVSGPFPINLLTLNSDGGYIDSKLRVLLLASFL